MDIWKQNMVIDGGMGTELTRCGAKDMNQHQLWASIVNVNEPEIVVKAHSNFIAAGADVLVTNSYKTNVPNLKEIMNYSDEEAVKATLDTIKHAFDAVGDGPTIVAGGIGPLPFAPASEYHVIEHMAKMTVAELQKWHEPRFKIFYESKCHILALETIPSTKEIEALLNLLTKYPKDAYLCLACSYNDVDSLNSGESIEDALKMIKRIAPPALKGIGVNCTKPPYISKFGRMARELFPDLTLITYPNSGEEWHPASLSGWNVDDGKWKGEKRDIGNYIREWKEIGFKWIGGCCRVTPDDIRAIVSMVKE